MTTLTTAEIIKGLTIKSQAGNNFAASLFTGYNKYKSFTPKQLPYARQIAAEGLGITLTPATSQVIKPHVKPLAESIGADFIKLIERFNIAKTNGLKRPALSFKFNNSPIKISLAPETGANKGYLYVKSDGIYMGKVSP